MDEVNIHPLMKNFLKMLNYLDQKFFNEKKIWL